jgi:hypothetical protein
MLQVRVSNTDFSSGVNFIDPIILERADNISLVKTVSSNDESITFEIPLNDPKNEYVNYIRWWECWDTETNTRLNYGPINEIDRTSGKTKKISGPGRSALLDEFITSAQTFYYPINRFFDDLRYENIAAEPRTSTIIQKDSPADDEYYGLSLRTKDYTIDEQTGFISIGRDTPDQGTIKSDVFWTGTAKSDWITVDLGDKYTISKATVLLPWWSGPTIYNTRTYDWSWGHGDSPDSISTDFITDVPNHGTYQMDPAVGGIPIYYGETGFEPKVVTISGVSATSARYWKLNITDTHAWYGNALLGTQSDEWDWECGESNVLLGESVPSPTISGGIIPKIDINPSSDCHASAVELGIYRKILDRDSIPNLAYHQIQDSSRQITYYHVPTAEEMLSGGKKYEPGTFFRNLTFTGDATVKDEYNTVIYQGAGKKIECPAYSRLLTFDSAVQVTYVDTWLGQTDAFSYGGSYSYSTVQNDYAILHFRGVSLKWFATVPDGVTAGQVSIELRQKADDGTWGGWTVLNASLTLPINVAAEKVFEITYESHQLEDNTVYELRITNLNGGYVSIDAFAGYWSATFEDMNQDDARFRMQLPSEALPSYNGKFSFGSIYGYKDGGHLTKMGYHFTGDRVIVYSRKGKNFGLIQIALWDNSGPTLHTVPIPGGEADGSLIIDLESNTEIPQYVVFDSNEYFTDVGLPWGPQWLAIYKPDDPDPIWVDGIGAHQESGLSVKFVNTTHLDMLKNTCETMQLEWDITENGLVVAPRIGTDTDFTFTEGTGTVIDIEDVADSSQIATMLVSNGADIDGLPLSTVVENKETRELFGRTIERLYDFSSVGDYFTLIGAARAELINRQVPQERVTINYYSQGPLPINLGDSFIISTPDGDDRYRAITITRNQSAQNGQAYVIESNLNEDETRIHKKLRIFPR